MDAYIFNADLLCAPCGEAKRLELDTIALAALAAAGKPLQDYDAWRYGNKAEYIRKHPRTTAMALGFDPEDESAYDSGAYPKGPTGRGGGEADGPQSCGQCGTFLENPLTDDGQEALAEMLLAFAFDGEGDPIVLKTWHDFYDGTYDVTIFGDAVTERLTLHLDRAAKSAKGLDESLDRYNANAYDESASYRENALFREGENRGSSRAIEGRE